MFSRVDAVERDVQRRFQSTRILIDELREVLVDATSLSRSLHGTLAGTLGDLSQSGACWLLLFDLLLQSLQAVDLATLN